MTIAVGIDAGTHLLGYAAIRADGPRLAYLEAGTISASEKRPVWLRLREIGSELDEWARGLAQANPDATFIAGVEAGYLDRRATSLILAEARGVACYVIALRLGVETRRYAPATIKKAATASGKATKEMVARFVMAQLGLRKRPTDDCADALATAVTRARDGRKDEA